MGVNILMDLENGDIAMMIALQILLKSNYEMENIQRYG